MRIRSTGTAVATLCLMAAIAGGALFLPGAMNSGAVQAPRISLDMAPAGNTYDDQTNTMTVGAIDPCLTSATANPSTHNHLTHLIIQDVEDLVGFQVRLNYVGDQMRPLTWEPAPFFDNTTGQLVGFINLPLDGAFHRTITAAQAIPAAPADGTNTGQTALVAASFIGQRSFPVSPDTPAKLPAPDDTSYSAPNGGILGALTLQVLGNETGEASLGMDLDDANPNPPGSAVVFFSGTGSTGEDRIDLAELALRDGFHGEGTNCVEQLPSPTATPTAEPTFTATPTQGPPVTPTPTPTPPLGTPTPVPAPRGTFNPQLSVSYSSTAPGSHPDIASTLSLGLGPDGQPRTPDDTNDYNFAGIVNFSPSSPADADVPDAAILGTLNSSTTQGILNNSCTSHVDIAFTFMEGTTDINNVVHMRPFGTGNELAEMAGDNPPFEGQQAVKPPPAVTKYPSFLNAIFDHDWVDYGPDRIAGNADDNNGPLPPIRPRFRAVATTYQTFAALWVIRQELIFEPGTDLPNLPVFDPAHGYPSVTVVQTSSAVGSATPPIAGPITDACTPSEENSLSSGVTGDNPDTAANEGGIPLRTMPSQPGTEVRSIFYSFSQRDADSDGYENSLDPCPFHFDSVWNPRDQTQPIEGDGPDTTPAGPASDGIPDTCDSTTEATGHQPVDHDNDGFPNRGDNCPVHSNLDQADRDRNENGEEVGDGIGDVCDTPGTSAGFDSAGRPIPGPRTVAGKGPLVPDGESIVCIKTITITVGGPNQAAVSECMSSFAPPVTPTPTAPPPTPTPTPAPSGPCPPTPTTSTLSDVVLGVFDAKSEHKFKLNENPDAKMEKVAVEAGVKESNLGREAYDVCLTLTDIPPNCTGRWRVVREETPGKFDRSDGNNDGLPDNLKFTKNGSLVDPITIYGGAPDKPIYLGPTGQAGDDISIKWRVLDVAPGEKVKVEPYMRYACSTVAERNYFFDVQITPLGKTDHEPSDNVAVDTTRLVIESP